MMRNKLAASEDLYLMNYIFQGGKYYELCVFSRGGQSGGAGGALATPGILIFQKQVTLFTKSGDTLELE